MSRALFISLIVLPLIAIFLLLALTFYTIHTTNSFPWVPTFIYSVIIMYWSFRLRKGLTLFEVGRAMQKIVTTAFESAMQKEIELMSKDLGFKVNFSSDAELKKFTKGEVLKLGQLRRMVKGTVVWVYYRREGEESPRINSAMRITPTTDEYIWGLEDGSSFVAEFQLKGPDTSECEDFESGEMRLYRAIKKT